MQRALLREYHETRDLAIRDQLVAANLRLALHLARRFSNRGVSLDDLEQVASLGLLRAIDRFDPDRGLEFSTFATPTIIGELKRHFRDKGWAVRVPRRVQELHMRLNTRGRRPHPPAGPLAHHRRAGRRRPGLRGGGARGDGGGPGLPLAVDRHRRGPPTTTGRCSGIELGVDDRGLFQAENRLLVEELLGPPRARATSSCCACGTTTR